MITAPPPITIDRLLPGGPASVRQEPARAPRISLRDPRIPFANLLTLYALLGCTILRFNRNPFQILLTVTAACGFDMFLARVLKRQKLIPLSAYISGLSLALLLNYSHNYYLLFFPVFLTIGSKYLLTYEGRHFYNPSLFGVAVSLLIGGDLISTAPSYQWGGGWAISAFLLMAALSLFIFRVGRTPLITSFLGFYFIQIALRAYIVRWHLPAETLVLGTLTSAPFFLFVFYMIPDPKTSPSNPRAQVWLALGITLVDLVLHLRQSLFTFFYAGFFVATARFLYMHTGRVRRLGVSTLWKYTIFDRQFRKTVFLLSGIGLGMMVIYKTVIQPLVGTPHLDFKLVEVPESVSGITSIPSRDLLDRVDPRVQHMAEWILAEGDSVASGDFDNDGNIDLFFTNAMKRPQDRNALYRNLGNYHFERVKIPALDAISQHPEIYGVVTNAMFVDYDNDGDQDLFLTTAFGKCILLRNMLTETGVPTFKDVTKEAGIDEYTVSVAANFLDFDRDGKIDLFIANAMHPYLDQYKTPTPFSLFHLPKAEYPGDRRMFHFMHRSWDYSDNGGPNVLYRNLGNGKFKKMDMKAMGMPETFWSLAVGTGDLNKDGWTDLYVADDFGPDELYLNEHGKHFRKVQGRFYGSIGKDTYKGMNSSLVDIDRNGYLDVYVSNVHMPLQAEGSLLWMTFPSKKDPFVPELRDEATRRGALNEHRFGWGAGIGDLNNDGWMDIVQANGMVDDTLYKKYDPCPNYWYTNEKLMRSGPEIHTYADMWGDIRGFCINDKDENRIYLNRGDVNKMQFVDVADQMGWKADTPSRGVALVDLTNSGRLDVVITHPFANASIYKNVLSNSSPTAGRNSPHWIGFKLVGDGISCNRDAVGTQLTVIYKEDGNVVRQLQEVQIVNGFAAQNDRRLHFGLGDFAGPVDVDITWCGAPVQHYAGMATGKYQTLVQAAIAGSAK